MSELKIKSEDISTVTVKEQNPIWLGIKLHLVDVGISAMLAFIMGIVIGAVGIPATNVQAQLWLAPIGLVVSIYVAFLLYRYYSGDVKSLMAMVIVSLLVGFMGLYVTIIQKLDYYNDLLIIVAQSICLILGWYLAKNTQLKLFSLPRKWITAFFVIGIVVHFFAIIGIISILGK